MMQQLYGFLNSRTKVAIGVLAVLLTILLFFKYTRTQHPPIAPIAAPQIPVRAATVIEQEVQKWQEYSGRLTAAQSVQIRPQVSGALESIHFQDGQLVKKGDLLFIIDPKPYHAECEQANATLVVAQAQLQQSEAELKRAKKLIHKKIISQNEFESKSNTVKINLANVNKAQAALEAARLRLAYTQIKAPLSGRISRSELSVGNIIDANLTSPLASIVSLSPVYVDFEVDEATYLMFAKYYDNKQPIAVKMNLVNDRGMTYQGIIDSFDNQLNVTSGTIKARAKFDNDDHRFIPGLFVKLKIALPVLAKQKLILTQAIGTSQNKKYVWCIDEQNDISYREIELGASFESLTIVNSGLNSGDKIVISGLQRVRPGSKVLPEFVEMQSDSKVTLDF